MSSTKCLALFVKKPFVSRWSFKINGVSSEEHLLQRKEMWQIHFNAIRYGLRVTWFNHFNEYWLFQNTWLLIRKWAAGLHQIPFRSFENIRKRSKILENAQIYSKMSKSCTKVSKTAPHCRITVHECIRQTFNSMKQHQRKPNTLIS